MEKWLEDSVLIRLENMRISGGPTSVDLDMLFPGKTIENVVETTLDGNLPLSELKRLEWNKSHIQSNKILRSSMDIYNVKITPKHIRFFSVKIE